MKIKLILFVLLLSGCNNNEYSNIKHSDTSNISINELNIDSVMFDGRNISMTGRWNIFNDKIIFMDEYMPQIIEFDKNGNYIGIKVRRGRGPDEMSMAGLFSEMNPQNEYAYFNGNMFFSILDTNYNFITQNKSIFNFEGMTDEIYKEIINNPDPSNPIMYDYEFDSERIVRFGDNKILMAVETEHPKLNAFDATISNFWTDALTFIVANTETGKLETVFGNYSPYFYDKRIPYLNAPIYDISDKNEFIIGFQPDSKIYVRDIKGKLLRSFGVAAKQLENIEYPEYQNFENSEANRVTNLQTLGYYSSLVCIDDYVLRTFQNNKQDGGGVQIYKNEVLIGEVSFADAPRFVGKDKENYIWMETRADEENEVIKFYKFKL